MMSGLKSLMSCTCRSVIPPDTGSADRARHPVRPGIDVGLRISDHDRLSGGAGRGVDADQFFARHREHVERVIVTQIGLYREWKMAEVGQVPEVLWLHTALVERFPIMRDIVVSVRQRPGEAPGLQRDDFVARCALG